jgi:2-methylisocitrate lyase-like PEP mutase family enzyme
MNLLRTLLETERPLIMPDAYDALSARLIEMAGFKAVQCSGMSMALASRACQEAQLSFEKNLEITRNIVQAARVPVMADGEDGFGPPARVFEIVGAYIEAGVCGINIEDQALSAETPKRVVERGAMVEKIYAAREAATAKKAATLVVNARTDALRLWGDRAEGLRESIERGNAYLAAGADLIFVVGVETCEEARMLVHEIHGPVSVAAGLPYNISTLSIPALREIGVARVSLPSVAVYSALRSVQKTLSLVYNTERFDTIMAQDLLAGADEIARLMER